MESTLQGIKRPMQINDETVHNLDEFIFKLDDGVALVVTLPPVQKIETRPEPVITCNEEEAEEDWEDREVLTVNHSYIIKVRQYMTKPSSPEFDFQSKWNNNIPMPFRVMKGTVLRETRGMVYMDCHAVPLQTSSCMVCGRRLTHPVSRLYGIGPECGQHAHINPFNTDEELYAALDLIRFQLSQIKWSGWIIKSAIEEFTEAK